MTIYCLNLFFNDNLLLASLEASKKAAFAESEEETPCPFFGWCCTKRCSTASSEDLESDSFSDRDMGGSPTSVAE